MRWALTSGKKVREMTPEDNHLPHSVVRIKCSNEDKAWREPHPHCFTSFSLCSPSGVLPRFSALEEKWKSKISSLSQNKVSLSPPLIFWSSVALVSINHLEPPPICPENSWPQTEEYIFISRQSMDAGYKKETEKSSSTRKKKTDRV